MKNRSTEYARALLGRCALSSVLTASFLTFTSVASAQFDDETDVEEPVEDAEPAEEDPFSPENDADLASDEDSDDTADEPEDTDPDTTTEETEEEEPEPEPLEAEASAEASTDIVEPTELDGYPAAPKADEDDDGDAEVEKTTKDTYKGLDFRVIRLPGTAYPQDPDPGIHGGSLELNMNRLQWPYVPNDRDEPGMILGLSGFAWVDSNFRQIKAGQGEDQTEYLQQGRLKLRVNPVYNMKNDWFLMASMEFVANLDQNRTVTNYVDVDEAWIRFGKWKWGDLTIGRQQGFEVYHFGMGLDLNTFERQGAVDANSSPAQPYVLNDLWDRGINYGGAALHLYLPKWLRLEMMARLGKASTGNDVGIRPVGVLDFGFVKLKAGYERRLSSSIFAGSNFRTEMQGFAGQAQFVYKDWVEGGAGIGHRLQDAFDEDGGVRASSSTTTTTYGGFLNVRPYFEDWLIGGGYHRTYEEDFNYDAFGEPQNSTHDQMFGAVQYLLWDKLYIKYVLSYSRGHIEQRNDQTEDDDGFVNESLSHRLRFMVLY